MGDAGIGIGRAAKDAVQGKYQSFVGLTETGAFDQLRAERVGLVRGCLADSLVDVGNVEIGAEQVTPAVERQEKSQRQVVASGGETFAEAERFFNLPNDGGAVQAGGQGFWKQADGGAIGKHLTHVSMNIFDPLETCGRRVERCGAPGRGRPDSSVLGGDLNPQGVKMERFGANPR